MQRKLSESEWRLMMLLWEESPLTISQMTAAVHEATGWTKYTVISLLSRMEGKGAIRHDEGGRSKLFYPVWKKEDAVESETRHFLDKVFHGNLGLLVNTMIGANALTQDDIAELAEILEKAKEGKAK